MAMSTRITGFRPPDARWAQMKAVWDACEAASQEVPSSVEEFFNHEPPDDRGICIDLKDSPSVTNYRADMEEGFQVEISKLPKELTHIRFVNSW